MMFSTLTRYHDSFGEILEGQSGMEGGYHE